MGAWGSGRRTHGRCGWVQHTCLRRTHDRGCIRGAVQVGEHRAGEWVLRLLSVVARGTQCGSAQCLGSALGVPGSVSPSGGTWEELGRDLGRGLGGTWEDFMGLGRDWRTRAGERLHIVFTGQRPSYVARSRQNVLLVHTCGSGASACRRAHSAPSCGCARHTPVSAIGRGRRGRWWRAAAWTASGWGPLRCGNRNASDRFVWVMSHSYQN